MIDNISFEIEGLNQPMFFINCHDEVMVDGFNPIDIPTVFFITDETWFHSQTPIAEEEDSIFGDLI